MEIPNAARIVTVADAWDALSNHIPCRKALSPAEVRSYFLKHAGSGFDPVHVTRFLALLDRK